LFPQQAASAACLTAKSTAMRLRTQLGFTLIELMIVVAVVAILASIAYPSYQTQIRKGRMGQAQADMLEVAQFMERCFASNNTYQTCALPFAASPRTGTSYYAITLATPNRTAFTLTATPSSAGGQNQQLCGTLTLNQAGQKTFSGTGATAGQCW
jgi:type IV pilus assembly protein PilE